MEAYHILERIGEGSFGRVYKARRKFTGQFVALKFMGKTGKTPAELEALRNEIHILRELDHPNIIQMLDCFETPKDVVLVTEFAYGELFSVLCEDKKLPEAVVQQIARQLASALHYLHSRRIIHRDMKPQNVLIGAGSAVKLADFGFSRQMSASTIMLTSIKGTPLYLAPEIFTDHAYEYKADLWGLGVMLYELAAGQPPFYANSLHGLMAIIMSERVRYPPEFSPAFRDFLGCLLERDPTKRRGWPDLLYHPWIAAAGPTPGDAPGDAASTAVSVGAGGSGGRSARASVGAAAVAAAGGAGGVDDASRGGGTLSPSDITTPAAALSPSGAGTRRERSGVRSGSRGRSASGRGSSSGVAAGMSAAGAGDGRGRSAR
jgi:fused-like protein